MKNVNTSEQEYGIDEQVAVEQRVADVIDAKGGLPDGNPFAETVTELQDDGKSWSEIKDVIDPVVEVITAAAAEEQLDAVREWEVITVAYEHDATTHTEFETHTVNAETAEKAEEKVESELPSGSAMSVDSSRTSYNGVQKE